MPASVPRRIAFRCDASLQIGTGHVMRCLTLADHLRQLGTECIFLGRPHIGNLLELARRRNHIALTLPMRRPVAAVAQKDPVHLPWLGATWEEDANDCIVALRRYLGDECLDWLVVDHYGLDARWESRMRRICPSLIAIDDLADRPHNCSILVDQNLGRKLADYNNLVPHGAQMLIGPHFAMLRPEFARLRSTSLARRSEPEFKRLLITMGGVDNDNATGRIIKALDQVSLPADIAITVVLGPNAPWLEQVRYQAANMRRSIEVKSGVDNMAQLMCDSDFSIGAAGSTSWERCCLGLPCITLVVAENQNEIASALERLGVVVLAQSANAIGEILVQCLHSRDSRTGLRDLGLRAAELCDGGGVDRIVAYLKDG